MTRYRYSDVSSDTHSPLKMPHDIPDADIMCHFSTGHRRIRFVIHFHVLFSTDFSFCTGLLQLLILQYNILRFIQ